MNTDWTRERRARGKARKLGYRIAKSRARNPRDVTFGGWLIADLNWNVLVGGEGSSYTLSIDEVEAFLNVQAGGAA